MFLRVQFDLVPQVPLLVPYLTNNKIPFDNTYIKKTLFTLFQNIQFLKWESNN